MAKGKDKPDNGGKISDKEYEAQLYELHVQLVKFQRDLIANGRKVAVVIEGRDGAGKDGTIKRIIEHMSPRETRVVALGKPSDRDRTSWYFQRYAPYLPAGGEFVLFNRSWYNRAGVERVMGFCDDTEYKCFLQEAPQFESMLVRSDIKLVKYYLDISKAEQKERLAARRADPLKQWKISPIDAAAIKKWDAYSEARDAMLTRTTHDDAPWHVAHADVKKVARLNIIRHLLGSLDYKGKDEKLLKVNPAIVFPFSEKALAQGLLAH
ncbi:MAG: polyphosphate kinase 2 [Alphaproteobacteria bacterium]|nr:polyphosphate kinase 2 [Alphaproteobacteria bacterium]